MTQLHGGLVDGQRALHVEYPVEDGEPMGGTDHHFQAIAYYGVGVLQEFFADESDVYVAGDNFLYYEEGNPKTVVSPDVYVVKGVEKRLRLLFKTWEEGGKKPCFALEVTSKSTRREDLGDKMFRYRDDLEVPEYFLFDPYGEWIPGRVKGYRLSGPGDYTPLEPNAHGRLLSEELGLELGVEEEKLRFYLPGAEHPLPTPQERADQETARADQETARADQAQLRADRESARAEAAEAELARLRAKIERLEGEA